MKKEYADFLLKKTQRDYNLIAEEFSRTRGKIWEELRFLFDNYLAEGDKLLDLGCGNGRYYEAVENASYVGVDSSEKLIRIAQKKYPEARFQVADSLNLPFPDNSFDKIYSIAVLHHIPSKEYRLQFLKEAKRVLKEDGLLILTVWKFHQSKDIFLLFKYTILRSIGKTKLDFKDIFEPWGKKIDRYYRCFSKGELKSLVKEAGFKIRKVGAVRNKRGNRRNIYLVAGK